MQFKIGDIVTIRSDLNANHQMIVPEMVEMGGRKFKVINTNGYSYYLEDNDFFWTDEMLVGKPNFAEWEKKNCD